MKGTKRASRREIGIGAVGSEFHNLKLCCCRMDQYEGYYEEITVNEVEQQEEVVGVVAPLPMEIPLEELVAPPADNPQSLSPSLLTPSLQVPSPPQGSPVGDATSFMGFYTHDDVVDLEQGTVDVRATRTNPATRIEEPDVSSNSKTFLRITRRPVGGKAGSGELIIEQLRAYLAGYVQLTSFSRRRWPQLFTAWTAQERREQLEALADMGGLWVI